jgi:cytochrome c oxidase cbb3-type subunit III
MNGFWSVWVMVLACVTVGVSLLLFVWGMRMRIPVIADGTTGHVWANGTLREAVRPLPLWWVLVSSGAFIVGVVYLSLYPGFGSFGGKLGWTSRGELQRNAAANDAKLEAQLAPLRPLSFVQLAANKDAVDMGHRLYLDNCAACHGREALGNHAVGAPDLTDADWLYGGDDETIVTSILDGRNGVMPPLEGALGSDGVGAVSVYVVSRNGTQAPPDRVAAGKTRFDALCSACHGADGGGNPALGAPNLFDNAWLYGRDLESVKTSVRMGRSGVMPAWRQKLTLDEVRLITAWVKVRGNSRKVAQ